MTWLDSSLPWAAAVGAILAAVAGFLAAVFTGIGAQASLAQAQIESKPVLVLTGELQSLSDLRRRKVEPPRNIYYLSPSGSMMVDVNPSIPTMTNDGHLWTQPPFFSRLELTNAGRLPLVSLILSGDVTFYSNRSGNPQHEFVPQANKTDRFAIRIPWLAPGATYVFAIAAIKSAASYKFARTIGVTRIDTEKPTDVTLFSADPLSTGEGGMFQPIELPLATAR